MWGSDGLTNGSSSQHTITVVAAHKASVPPPLIRKVFSADTAVAGFLSHGNARSTA